jgi:transposase
VQSNFTAELFVFLLLQQYIISLTEEYMGCLTIEKNGKGFSPTVRKYAVVGCRQHCMGKRYRYSFMYDS